MRRYRYRRVLHSERWKTKIKEGEYIDWVTAASGNMRPSLRELMKVIEEGDEIEIESIENLGYSNGSLYKLVKEIKGRGCKIVSVKEGIEISGEEQYKLLESTENVMKAKQKEGIERAIESGTKFGRELQYGLDEEEVNRAMSDYHSQLVSWREAADRIGIEKKSTFFYRYNKWQKERGIK